MRKILIIFCSMLFSLAYSQANQDTIYTFYIKLNHYSNAPEFEKNNDLLIYSGSDIKESDFFANYQILMFKQSFPSSKRENNLNYFSVATYNHDLMEDLLAEFSKYILAENTTNYKLELLNTYPNDYGTTSPVTNLGYVASRKDLDYINAPKAWDITTGDKNVKIGISDGNVDIYDIDLIDKTERLPMLASIFPDPTYYNFDSDLSWHGTSVAVLAAGQGDNSGGTVGVCSDCSVVANILGFGYTIDGQQYNHLLDLAQKGVKVINMSWRTFATNIEDYWDNQRAIEQDIIDELVEDYNVVLVAAAGNKTSFATPTSNHSGAGGGYYTGVQYEYPASYDKVISVSSISHKYDSLTDPGAYCCTSAWFPNYTDIADSVSPVVDGTDVNNPVGVTHNGYYQSWTNTDGLVWMHTLNKKVDILAPGYNILISPFYSHNNSFVYGSGTSSAAPQVSGTVGLMVSVDKCLNYKEVEDILQLTTKDVEHMPINQNFYGMVGAGKLETGDAVEFVYEMNKSDGNAIINNHIFYRFDFDLERINNKLTIDKVTFKDKCTSYFIARNVIDVLDSDFNPNAEGYVDLNVNENLDMSCSSFSRPAPQANNKTKTAKTEVAETQTKLYPNPNNGAFTITFGKQHKNVNIEVFDIYGKSVYKATTAEPSASLNIQGISGGMYIVKLSSDNYAETLKFVKK